MMEKKLQIRPRAVSILAHRIFLHVDLDAFFASVEIVKNPKLKGRPVIVGGRNSRRGVVAAASYEAKRFGIETGMPWPQAREKCPHAVFLPADFDAYAQYSRRVQKILEEMSPVVAPASVDESYLDITNCERIYGTPRDAAEKIHNAVKRQTGLEISVGIAASQSVAKMASKFAKPSGMMEVPAGSEEKFLAPLPVEAMPGIGSRIGERLRGIGIVTLGQLACMPAKLLRAAFGVYGPYLKAKARGEDTWELEVTEVIKSIGKQKTLEEDVSDPEILHCELRALVEIVGQKLREENLYARSLLVYVRYSDFTGNAASRRFKDPTNFDRILFAHAKELLQPLIGEGHPELGVILSRRRRIRLIGITAQELLPKPPQLDLFRTLPSHRWERFYACLDQIQNRIKREFVEENGSKK